MELQLIGKRALVTGGSRGIGLACAHALAAEGVHLAIAAREVEPLKDATRALRKGYDVDVTSHSCDLARTDHQRALVDVVGPVDIVVNNAGAVPAGDLAEVDDGAWRRAWDLKVFGTVNLCRMLLPRMEERGSGVVVNIIGTAAERPRADRVAVASGNAALDALTRALGGTTALHGVRVVGVSPGPTLTDRMETMLRDRAEATLGNPDRWRELIPDPPPSTPEQIADVVVFLASARASRISGTVVTVDGGAAAR